MTDDLTRAPWTPAEVRRLNEWQTCGWVHPYTCGRCRDRLGTVDDDDVHNDRRLVATANGWMCPTCDYAQEWAWIGMLAGPPPNPLAPTRRCAMCGMPEGGPHDDECLIRRHAGDDVLVENGWGVGPPD